MLLFPWAAAFGASAPVLSLESGFYQQEITLEIRSDRQGAQVYYTLDGSEDLELNILKPDGTTNSQTLPSTSGDHVDLTITSSMSDTPGANYAKLRIDSIGTSAFILQVETKP